ncbi:hypothetical protein G6F37_012414 [Rhizopus arrhizus]|nr:hypothetical protein G6F37_012414 [Rhizopus arrhizus]KAG1148340.1 hypothetical protein G6F38_003580 [Rhizopus arrhizus]
MFIKNTRNEIQDNTFKSRKYADSRGSRMFSSLPLYDCKSKSVQIDESAFWKVAKSCTNNKEGIPKKQLMMALQHDTQDSLTFLN